MDERADWLKGVTILKVFEVGAAAASVVVMFLVFLQWQQANEHQRWGNYNEMNARYSALYNAIPDDLDAGRCKAFAELDANAKRWIRSYFDLYSEESWLNDQRLIPEEMWTSRIDGGVDVNLISYPALAEGYQDWKRRGAFKHPAKFIPAVDAKIARLQRDIDQARRTGCNAHSATASQRTIAAGNTTARQPPGETK
jgi:hypothetical protein